MPSSQLTSAITGQGLYDRIMDLCGMTYTEYLSQGQQTNMWIAKAFIETIFDFYKEGIQDQATKDELSSLVTSDFEVPYINPATNTLLLSDTIVMNATYANAFATSTITVYTVVPHNLVTNGYISINGFLGLTPAPDGVFQVTVLTPNTFTFVYGATLSGTYTNSSAIFYSITGNPGTQLQITDYLHLLNVITTYAKVLYPPPGIPTLVVNATNTTPIRVTMFAYNNLRDKENISMSGFTGLTAANGSFYIRKVNDLQFDLYSDVNLQNPVAGNGAFDSANTPVISRIFTYSCKPLQQDEEGSVLSKPSEDSPRYVESDWALNFKPSSLIESLSISYIRKPLNIYEVAASNLHAPYSYVLTENDTLDLTKYYHPRFIERIPEKILDLLARESRDGELMKDNLTMRQLNP